MLNVKGNRIYENKVENVHRESIGVLEVTKEQAKRSCQLWLPGNYLDAWKEIDASPADPYYFAVEKLFSHLEASSFYQVLSEVICDKTAFHCLSKVNLAGFIILQLLRNAEILRSIVDALSAHGKSQFDLFLALSMFLNDIQHIQKLIPDVAHGEWVFYKTDTDCFPLPDLPVMVEGDSTMIALSPRLLLEIKGKDPGLAASYRFRNRVPDFKMEEFRTRTIRNTFKEIIFGDRDTLCDWQRSPEFQTRRADIANKQSAIQVQYAGEPFDELWLVDLCRKLLFPADGSNFTSS